MIDELHLFGVFMPAALVWATIAGILAYSLRNVIQHLPLYTKLWHPGLLELAVFTFLWWAITRLADAFLPQWVIS